MGKKQTLMSMTRMQWPRVVGAALVINTLTKPSAQCWFSMHNPAMHGTNIKSINLVSNSMRIHAITFKTEQQHF
jgi:hypothetical protein